MNAGTRTCASFVEHNGLGRCSVQGAAYRTQTGGGFRLRRGRLLAPDGGGRGRHAARFEGHRKELIDPLMAAYHGRIVKTTGDGILAEFASAVDAIGFAVVVQKGMVERNADVPKGRRTAFRAGINVGDIIGQRHLWRRGQRRGAAGGTGRPRWHLHLGGRVPAGA